MTSLLVISPRRESWDTTFHDPSVCAWLQLHVFGNTIPSTANSSTRLTSATNTWLRCTFVRFDKRVYHCGALETLLKYAAYCRQVLLWAQKLVARILSIHRILEVCMVVPATSRGSSHQHRDLLCWMPCAYPLILFCLLLFQPRT
jgi:hypothetical protein